jgi:hypothetical protein
MKLETYADLVVSYYGGEREKLRDDPAFYAWDSGNHQHVATVSLGKRSIDIFCDGEMRAEIYKDNDHKVHLGTVRYCDDLSDYGFLTDRDLEIAADRINWVNNAWFDLYSRDETEGDQGWLDCVGHNLEEMILWAGELLEAPPAGE